MIIKDFRAPPNLTSWGGCIAVPTTSGRWTIWITRDGGFQQYKVGYVTSYADTEQARGEVLDLVASARALKGLP